jgi:hypothetical protein
MAETSTSAALAVAAAVILLAVQFRAGLRAPAYRRRTPDGHMARREKGGVR